ncbi:MAG: hypothetical protein M9894_16600 [Planctomycetes bacterium]|nr:hypothetical protein [Planctomycetota bacterium]
MSLLRRIDEDGRPPRWLHVDHDPADIPAVARHGVLGRPHRALEVTAGRVEVRRGWCFSSGHMEVYEEEPEAGWALDDPAVVAGVARLLGEAVAAEVVALRGASA